MSDEEDNLSLAKPAAKRQATFDDVASAKKAALDRNTKRQEDKVRTVWPPALVGLTEPVAEKPARKASNSILVVTGVVFMTLWAFLVGYVAGSGHKDFSESLVGNIGWALFDLLLWSLPILYWFGVLRSQWRVLRNEPTVLRKIVFAASSAVLIAVYGSGLGISLICLTARTAVSNTIY